MFFYTKSKIVEHVELFKLNNVNLSFIRPKLRPHQWLQFITLNPHIRNLTIFDKYLNAESFMELTKLKKLRRMTLKSDLLSEIAASTSAKTLRTKCSKLVELSLDDFCLENTDYEGYFYDSDEEFETTDEDSLFKDESFTASEENSILYDGNGSVMYDEDVSFDHVTDEDEIDVEN